MKDNDAQNIFENYLAGGIITDTPVQEEAPEQEPTLNENPAALAKFLPQIVKFITSNPQILQQITQAIPDLASLLGGGAAPAAPAAPAAAPAPGAGAPQKLGGQLPAGSAPAPVPAA